MTRAITIRLDDADHAELERQAGRLGVRPGTLARILVRGGLRADAAPGSTQARAALERLTQRARQNPPGDAVELVAQARAALDSER